MTCEVQGQPKPSIRWYKDGKHLINTDPRVDIINSGTLRIAG